jgi:hypothetical protein
MAEKPDLPIDFERAANLMDVVQKVASIAPTYTALSSVAMMELKEYNEAAQEYLNEIAQQRAEAEQEAAAEAEQERLAAEPKAVPAKTFGDFTEPVRRV